MRCSRAHRLISDYISRELDQERIRRLEDHLESCASCRRLMEDLDDIVNAAAELETVSPSSDIWSSIQKGIGKPRNEAYGAALRNWAAGIFPMPRPLAVAMSIMLAGLILTGLFYRHAPFLRDTRVLTREESRSEAVADHLMEAERHYRLAIAELSRSLNGVKGRMDPELERVFSENIAIIDQSILACRNALKQYPGDLDTQLYLLASYRKKIDLLTDMRETSMPYG